MSLPFSFNAGQKSAEGIAPRFWGRRKTFSGLPPVHGKGEAQLDPAVRDRMALGETCTQHSACASLTQAQLAEPPYADPHVRWCGGRAGDCSPYPDLLL
jgi:hypothetical protein